MSPLDNRVAIAEIEAGQCWTYRAPRGFEASRILVGATVKVKNNRIICCSVVGAPKRIDAAPDEKRTIPFLPIVEGAFRATAVALDGYGELPAAFDEIYPRWRSDPLGLAAFTVPFMGFLENMLDLQAVRKSGEAAGEDAQIAPVLREMRRMLEAGLVTEKEPFPKTAQEFAEILTRLRQLDPDDLEGKLVIGGFQITPYGPDQQRCLECIYFLPHRLWCDLPELAVPVEPYWWCRLWRI
jgi:hypothetical protein